MTKVSSNWYLRNTKVLSFNIRLKYLLFIIALLQTLISNAQLSPGKLTKAHSKLEGIANCTQCHTIGDKIDNQKCLSCHKELLSRVSKNKGFHSSSLIKNKECITCHSEHHGLGFEMVRFDKKTFNHNLTGYELKGAHKTKVLNCNECHTADNIANASLKVKTKTYLGLESKCLSCHDDYHQKTLSSDCITCHTFNDFKNAKNFNHENTAFALKGSHKTVDCASCHKSELRNNKRFVKYADVAFNNCSSCHKDVHKSKFGANCEACHTEDSFNKITATKSFNHSVTGYSLEGKHKEINCKKCHENTFGSSGGFQEYTKTASITCLTCHKDIHEGKLGTDCKSCHNQNSFLLKNKTFVGKFDHDKTDYPLKGKHQVVDCKVCHKSDFTEAIQHNNCISCHSDKHNGEFDTKKGKYPDCASCHKVDGFTPSNYTIEMHNQHTFKLEGAHLAQPCFACHRVANKWVFTKIGTNCISCHNDIHNGSIDAKFYGEQSCKNCHGVDNWQQISFNHKNTGYELKGGHLKAKCGDCHFNKSTSPVTQHFKGLTKQCSNCHNDVHGKQFERNGITDCAKCHQQDSWNNSGFNHDRTNFKLDGKHKSVSCEKCHKEVLKENKKVRVYKIPKHQCIDCHL